MIGSLKEEGGQVRPFSPAASCQDAFHLVPVGFPLPEVKLRFRGVAGDGIGQFKYIAPAQTMIRRQPDRLASQLYGPAEPVPDLQLGDCFGIRPLVVDEQLIHNAVLIQPPRRLTELRPRFRIPQAENHLI